MTRFIVMKSRAPSPWGTKPYIRVAVVEIEEGFVGVPKMISERAKGVVRIYKEWPCVYEGKTSRSEGGRALAEAEEICRQLNCPLERLARV